MIILIMAGGLGKRMESDIPKVLHEVCHPTNSEIQYPMIILVLLAALKLNPTKIFKDENQSNEDYIEDFSNMIYDTSTVNVNKTYFWVGTTIILISILCCNKIIKH